MKQQTFIAFILDANGKRTDFERFTCKRSATVKRHMLQLMDNCLYRACCDAENVRTIEIYATPDGVHTDAAPVDIITL